MLNRYLLKRKIIIEYNRLIGDSFAVPKLTRKTLKNKIETLIKTGTIWADVFDIIIMIKGEAKPHECNKVLFKETRKHYIIYTEEGKTLTFPKQHITCFASRKSQIDYTTNNMTKLEKLYKELS